ncbi:PE domain-containing protein [Mycobacterium sp. Marseille-P9652]|nr:PE domain-containing protein [Mycobacterium sp. Marseille-P9652]
MSYLLAVPQSLSSAASELSGIGSTLTEANRAGAARRPATFPTHRT